MVVPVGHPDGFLLLEWCFDVPGSLDIGCWLTGAKPVPSPKHRHGWQDWTPPKGYSPPLFHPIGRWSAVPSSGVGTSVQCCATRFPVGKDKAALHQRPHLCWILPLTHPDSLSSLWIFPHGTFSASGHLNSWQLTRPLGLVRYKIGVSSSISPSDTYFGDFTLLLQALHGVGWTWIKNSKACPFVGLIVVRLHCLWMGRVSKSWLS